MYWLNLEKLMMLSHINENVGSIPGVDNYFFTALGTIAVRLGIRVNGQA
jgi:hypothetical protein